MTHGLVNDPFVQAAASSNPPVRIDGRGFSEFRDLSIDFGPLNGQAEVRVGKTVTRTCVVGEITPPLPDRPNEGRLFFNVEVGQIANPAIYEYGRPTSESTTLCNYVERVLRGSKAIDSESLCILGGKSVWSIRADTHTLCADGSLADACSLSTLCALLNFKHEAVSTEGDEAVLFSAAAREPVPLSVHHLPISTTFAIFDADSGSGWLADPSADEERALGSSISITVNQHGELCGIHKPGGLAIDLSIISECMDVAIRRAKLVSELIRSKMAATVQQVSRDKRKRETE